MKKYIDIFFRFCRVGGLTFGGGLSMLPIIERELSEGKNPYLTKEAISDNYALAQCAPGIIAINTSILCGYQIGGTAAGIVAAIGVSVPSIIVILIIASIMSTAMSNPVVVTALLGIRAGVCALILRTVVNLSKKSVVDKITLILFFIAMSILMFVNVSPVVPVVIGGIIGVGAKLTREKKAGDKK